MKLLFITTYNVTIQREHFFTIDVWNGLYKHFNQKNDEIALATIILESQNADSFISEESLNGCTYYKLHYSSSLSEEEKVDEIIRFYKYISPDVIHSNMIEVIDVEAAKKCNIPIVLTIHIGGFICPRGGGNGFLKYDDSICQDKVGKHCFRCCAQDFPLSFLARCLYSCTSARLREWAYHKLRNKQIFYLTQFLIKSHEIIQRQKAIETYKYATIIAANQRLKDILSLNGLTDNVLLIPHGVKPRLRLPFPEVKDVVKFYYCGRIQYSKGLHNLLSAFDGIDKTLYELHVIGDAESSGPSRRYDQRIRKMAIGKNVIFHGRLPNESIESVIKDMHVMVHPAIFLEVYGISIAESLSIGRPVLATRCGGAEMQVCDGVNGWLVEPNDVKALHVKIEGIIHQKNNLGKISNNCELPHPMKEYVIGLVDNYKSALLKNTSL